MSAESAAALPWLAAPLRDALAHQRAHATLIHGPAGVGQFELALALAQAWLCETAGEPGSRPCGQCTSCHLMHRRAHPDFHLLVPEALRESLGWAIETEGAGEGAKKAKPSREIRVDAVRAAIEWGQQTSSRGRAKVVLIHPASALNLVAANALLKTLEEPPGLLRLILSTTDPETLLPTLRSRCQRLPLAGPPHGEAVRWLQAQGVGDPGLMLAASGGQPLEVLAMLGEGIDADLWRRLPALVQRGDTGPLAGLPLPRLIASLQKLCHDLMATTAGAAPRYFEASSVPALAAHAPLVGWAKSLARAARHDEHPWNARLLAEALVLEGRTAWQGTAAPAKRFDTLPPR